MEVHNVRTKYSRNSDLASSAVKRLIKNLKRLEQLVILNGLAIFKQVVKHKTFKQFGRVLLKVQESWFGFVVRNWTFREALYNVFQAKFASLC